MLVVAKSQKGAEFLYAPESAHQVAKAHAAQVRDMLNFVGWELKEGETWFLHEVDQYDDAFCYASAQRFTWSKGALTERRGRA